MPRGFRYLYVIALAGAVSACQGITTHQYNDKGEPINEKEVGLLYYLPKPYLLVAEVPVDTTSSSKTVQKDGTLTTETTKPGGSGSPTQPGGTPSTDSGNGNKNDNSSSTSPSTPSDTSFGLATQQYSVKLVYLPDYQHPVTAVQTLYPFMTSDFKPTLQDGWMLTALDVTSDTTGSTTLSSLASLVSAIKGGGSSATGTSSKTGGSGMQAQLQTLQDLNSNPPQPGQTPVLPPGLYAIDFGETPPVYPVVFFCVDGPKVPTGTQSDKHPATGYPSDCVPAKSSSGGQPSDGQKK